MQLVDRLTKLAANILVLIERKLFAVVIAEIKPIERVF